MTLARSSNQPMFVASLVRSVCQALLLIISLVTLGACSSNGTDNSIDEPVTNTFTLQSLSNSDNSVSNELEDEQSTSVVDDVDRSELPLTDEFEPIDLSPSSETELVLPVNGEIPSAQTPSVLDEILPAAKLLSILGTTSNLVLANLNRKLSGGEELSVIEENCLYDYDPAEGRPLLGLQCSDSRINLDELGILNLRETAFLDSDACTNTLTSEETIACDLHAINLQLNNHTDSLILQSLDSTVPQFDSESTDRDDYSTDNNEIRPDTTPPDDEIAQRHSLTDLEGAIQSDRSELLSDIDLQYQQIRESIIADTLNETNHDSSELDYEFEQPQDNDQTTTPESIDESATDSDSSQTETDHSDTENSSTEDFSFDEEYNALSEQIDRIITSIIAQNPDESVIIESSDTSNIATNIEVSEGDDRESLSDEYDRETLSNDYDTTELVDSRHAGATVQLDSDGRLIIEPLSISVTGIDTCILDTTTAELLLGNATDCDAEFERLTERLHKILTTITEDPSSQ